MSFDDKMVSTLNRCTFDEVFLVTGGCGFVGSHFLNHFVPAKPNCKFINVDAMYYCASHDNLSKVTKESKNYFFFECNINNIEFIKHILIFHQVTTVVHFAAQSHVDSSFVSNLSLSYTEDNVKGTHSLLEAVRQSDPNKTITFLHFSTDEVYGESRQNEDAKTEISLMCPTNPYAASKAASELIVSSYHHSYGLKCIITRGNNIIGTNQYPEKLVPKFINQLLQGEKCTVHGTGKSMRSFISVYDVCTAVETILKKGKIGEIYNIGSAESNERSVLQVAEHLVKAVFGNEEKVENHLVFVDDRPFNDMRYFISNQKLQKLGWAQTITFEQEVDLILTHLKKVKNRQS
jgi:dTDP-glucose 4,6-dehydratase